MQRPAALGDSHERGRVWRSVSRLDTRFPPGGAGPRCAGQSRLTLVMREVDGDRPAVEGNHRGEYQGGEYNVR
jgi:hypothetical protein